MPDRSSLTYMEAAPQLHDVCRGPVLPFPYCPPTPRQEAIQVVVPYHDDGTDPLAAQQAGALQPDLALAKAVLQECVDRPRDMNMPLARLALPDVARLADAIAATLNQCGRRSRTPSG